MIDYHNKKFRVISTSTNGEVSKDMVFEYRQLGRILSCEYSGGQIKSGHLIGIIDDSGVIDMRYHQIDINLEVSTGKCTSMPEVMSNGKIRLHETWEWTSGDFTKGTSVLEEV